MSTHDHSGQANDAVAAPPLRNGITTATAFIAAAVTVGVAASMAALMVTREAYELSVTFTVVAVLAGPAMLWWVGFFESLGAKSHSRILDHLPAPPGLFNAQRAAVQSLDDYHRQKTARAHELVEQLIYDYGLLLTGQQPDFAYAGGQVATVLRQTVAPVLRAGDRIRPDFGSHVDVTIDWHSDDVRQPVTATAYFVDMSTRIAESGMGVKMPRQRMRLTLAFDHQLATIIDATIGPA